jgi:atypical dual specificity phosphatase
VKLVLDLAGFGVAFGARIILSDMTLVVPAQGCTVLLGPSGTGKSTLVRTLAGLNDANPSLRSWGRALYKGEPVSVMGRPALVAQKAHLLMATVQDNMVAKLAQRSSLTRARQLEMVGAFLEQAGQAALAAKLATPVIDLPLHEQRIIGILRQALPGPALLMVDEPTVNLSPEGAQAVLGLLGRLARQRAVLMVSHHLAQTRQIADQVILMADGVVQESALKDDFFLRPQTAAAQHYLRTGSCPESGVVGRGADQALPLVDEPPDEQARAEACARAAMATVTFRSAGPRKDSPLPAVQDLQRLAHFRHLQANPAAKSAFCGPRGFVWLIGGKLAGTPWPGILRETHQDLQALRDVGITRLISLTETPFDPALAAPYGIECTAVPMPDMCAPSQDEALFLCHEIDRYLHDAEAVAVHCKAGLGRTGTVLALYWIWLGGGKVSGAAAMEYVRRQETGMIQSQAQENFLENFAELLTHRPAGTIPPSPALALEAEF